MAMGYKSSERPLQYHARNPTTVLLPMKPNVVKEDGSIAFNAVYLIPGHSDACSRTVNWQITRNTSWSCKCIKNVNTWPLVLSLRTCSKSSIIVSVWFHRCRIKYVIHSSYIDFIAAEFFQVSKGYWISGCCYWGSVVFNWGTQCLSSPSDSCQRNCIIIYWKTELGVNPGVGDWM